MPNFTIHEVFAYLFDIGLDILASTLDPETGTITSQLGDVAKNRADSNNAENWWGAPGIVGRAALPDQGVASCQVICLKRSARDLILAYRDLRSSSIYGNLGPGETCVYATTGMARAIFKSNGSARLFTTDDNTETGNVIFAGVSPFYQGADGQQHPGGEWRRYAPWGGEWHDPSGYHFRSWQGVKIDIGGLTFPAPIGATCSTYALQASIVTVKATAITLGVAAAAQPLVKGLALQTLMGTFAGEVQSFTGALRVFLLALGGYAAAIKATADPTNAATPALASAIGAMEIASTAFATATTATMATLLEATGATSTAAS